MSERTFAFQCKHCGALEPAAAAGENEVPHACHVCGHGVKFEVDASGTNVNKVYEPDNWLVLADASQEELAKLTELHDEIEVEKHTPLKRAGATASNEGTAIK